jgi:excinuclease ABC subunit B
MEGARTEVEPRTDGKRDARSRGAQAPVDLRPEAIVRQIKKLEAEMFKKARNLEFEEAAKLRDDIEQLKQLELGFGKTRAG